IVLLDFWATWCDASTAGMKELLELRERFQDMGLKIIGISFDEQIEPLHQALEHHGIPWPQYFDGKGWENDCGRRLKIRMLPTRWLIGKDGRVIDTQATADLTTKVAHLLQPLNKAPGGLERSTTSIADDNNTDST